MAHSIISFGRGHTIVCDSKYVDTTQSMLKIPSACTVRVWGTQKGLGELSAHGPTKSTTLDAIAFPLAIPRDAIHIIYECSAASSESFTKDMKKAEAELLKPST